MTWPEAGSEPTANEAVWPDGRRVHHERLEPDPVDGPGLEDLIGMLAADLETVISRTLLERSPDAAREFADRVTDTDLAMMADGEDAGTLGQSVAFLVLSSWLTAVSDAQFDPRITDPSLTDRALDWVRVVLPPECAPLALRASGTIGLVPDEDVQQVAADLGDDFLPGLVWFVAGLVAEYGGSDTCPPPRISHPGYP
jgi:hypothetical protein